MSTLDVVGDDAEIAIFHQVVRAGSHEVVSLAVKSLVVGVACGRASLVAGL